MVGLLRSAAWLCVISGIVCAVVFWPSDEDSLAITQKCLEEAIANLEKGTPFSQMCQDRYMLKPPISDFLDSHIFSFAALISGLIFGLVFGAAASLLNGVQDIKRLLEKPAQEPKPRHVQDIKRLLEKSAQEPKLRQPSSPREKSPNLRQIIQRRRL